MVSGRGREATSDLGCPLPLSSLRLCTFEAIGNLRLLSIYARRPLPNLLGSVSLRFPPFISRTIRRSSLARPALAKLHKPFKRLRSARDRPESPQIELRSFERKFSNNQSRFDPASRPTSGTPYSLAQGRDRKD